MAVQPHHERAPVPQAQPTAAGLQPRNLAGRARNEENQYQLGCLQICFPLTFPLRTAR